MKKLVLILLLAIAAAAQTDVPPDTLYVNGDFYTPVLPANGGNATEARRFQALAVKADRIVAVGPTAEMMKRKGPGTQVVDLGGRFAMPGFNDAHTHLANAGFEKLNVSLTGVRSLAEMKQRIAERARTAPAGVWLQGRGWDHTTWADKKLPSRQDLDEVTGDHPAIFTRVDGHISVVNTAALRLSKITRETKDPPGGTVDRDEKGEPTGILREAARGLLARIPPPTPTQRRQALELAIAEAVRFGVTTAQDNSAWEDFLVLEDLQREGRLPMRVTEWLSFRAPIEALQRQRGRHAASDPQLHTGLLKAVLDGTLGSRTADLIEPYHDDPHNSGLPQFEQPKLVEMTRERVLAGFQMGFHAIGDEAARNALDAFAESARAAREQHGRVGKGELDLRLRIEHAQVLKPEHFGRMVELGVIASMQPNHLLTDMNWAESRIGPVRKRHSYAWRSMLKNGIPLAFGTDYPVEPVTPFRGLYAAVTRRDEAGAAEYVPEEKLTMAEAIAAYTVGAAYAEFAQQEKGTLGPGMLADFVVLDRDLLKAAPADVLKTQVLRTVVGGKTVFKAEN